MPLTLFRHQACAVFDLPDPVPDRARRLSAIDDQLIANGLDPLLIHREAPAAPQTDLEGLHDPTYLASLAASEPSAGSWAMDGDTLLVPGIVAAAHGAAGAALAAVEQALAGAGPAFALTRPPGHHARRQQAAGFCLINHAALAAYRARACGAGRVAVVDFDAHHGDGTEALVAADPGIRLFSLFEAGGFAAPDADGGRTPAATSGPGQSQRLALPPGATGEQLQQAVAAELVPALEGFGPEAVVVSAGFDGHREDDLSGLRWTEADYRWLIQRLMTACQTTAASRLVLVLEGGYAPDALGRSVAAVVAGILDAR